MNQVGGKLSDALGRKPFLLLGPLASLICGSLVVRNPGNRLLVLACRVCRLAAVTFSNTVMITAALADTCSGTELSQALSSQAAYVGISVVTMPFVEGKLLELFQGRPQYTYGLVAALGFFQFFYSLLAIPETLKPEKRRPLDVMQAINPFGFYRVFTEGSRGLKKLVCCTTLQMSLEGKNLADLTISVWIKEHLQWGSVGIQRYIASTGVAQVLAGWYLVPYLMRKYSARGYTSFTNSTNILAFLVRAIEHPAVFCVGLALWLPGCNGISSTAFKALATDVAAAEGFGKGEFSAWNNNLRAIQNGYTPIIYGWTYAWTNKFFPGAYSIVACIMGAVIPELIHRSCSDADLDAKARKQLENSST